MFEWWDGLSLLSKFFYYIAIPSTTILLIQSIMTLIGVGMNAGGDMEFDADMDGDMEFEVEPEMEFEVEEEFGMQLDGDEDFEAMSGVVDFRFITIRGIIAFLTMFGWVGAAMANAGLHILWTLLGASVAGLASMYIIAMLFYGISKLQSSGNINYKTAIGREATVYIPIPPNKDGFGKIQLTLQERLIEVNAVTEEDEMIGTNKSVRIIDMLNATTFVVERLK